MKNHTFTLKNIAALYAPPSFAYLAITYMLSSPYLHCGFRFFSSTLFCCKLYGYLFFPAPFLAKQSYSLFAEPRHAEYAYLFLKHEKTLAVTHK